MKTMLMKIFNTNSIPVAGGSFGAITSNVWTLPTHNQILATIVLAIIGAVVGYLVKLGLDYFIKKIKNKRLKNRI